MISLFSVILLIFGGLLLYGPLKIRSKYSEVLLVGFVMIAFWVTRAYLHIERILYVGMWVLYFFVLYKLFRKKSIYAPIFLLCCGALKYKLPLLFGFEARLFQAGILFCLGLSMLDYVIRPKSKHYDRLIWYGILIYYVLMLFSVLLRGKFDRLPTMIYVMINQSLLFFVTIQCIKDERDAQTLLKGVFFAVCLMGALGVIGYLVNDPWWGQQVYDNPKILEARNPSLPYEMQVRLSGQWEGRVSSTASNANALGATMVMCFPIGIYLWFSAGSFRGKLLIAGALGILVSSLFLSGSRTAFVAGSIMFLTLTVSLMHDKKRKIGLPKYLFGIGVAIFIILIVAFNSYLSSHTYQRFARIQSISDFYDAGNRTVRWKREISRLDKTYLLIGRGVPGSQGAKGAHSNYIGIIYAGGFFALVAFLVFFVRALRNSLRLEDRLMGLCFFALLIGYAINSITQESAFHHGPGFVFWPVIAVLATCVSRKVKNQSRMNMKPTSLPTFNASK